MYGAFSFDAILLSVSTYIPYMLYLYVMSHKRKLFWLYCMYMHVKATRNLVWAQVSIWLVEWNQVETKQNFPGRTSTFPPDSLSGAYYVVMQNRVEYGAY